VLSDNVVDHAEDPVKIIEELARVLKPGGLLFFTVNIHHPFYDLVSRAHGIWNGLGIRFEISPFADHTVHFTEKQVREIFGRLPLDKMQIRSTVAETKNEYRILKAENAEQRLKKIFYKNALIEIIAVRG
jgi:SAM-dependent methyltransferase